MKRYIITGTPSAGKTAILLELEARGFAVVPEAAAIDRLIRFWGPGAQGIPGPGATLAR